MSEDYNLNEAYTLGAGIGDLSRPELLELAHALCRRLMDVDGAFHGGVHPWNISRSPEGEVGIGPAPELSERSSEQLEYMSPELFWEHTGDATADVYSIGLLIFAGLNKGRLPFVTKAEPTPEERVAALRRRLSGDTFPLPASAGEKLGGILLKALSYKASERYSGPVELLGALSDCPDAEEDPFSAFVPAAPSLTPEKPESAPAPAPTEYKVDKSVEDTRPPRPKRNWRPYIIVGVICVGLILLALVVKIFVGDKPGPIIVDATPPVVTESVEPTAEPSAEPTVEPTVEPTAEPQSTYTLYIENVSWTQAKEACEIRGGHLVTISDSEEFKTVTALAESYDAELIWVGFYRDDTTGALTWVTGEDIQYFPWGVGEPSLKDTDGTPENYGLLWHYKGAWIYNDSRNDPVGDYPAAYSGKIAYICEFDPE